VVILINLLKILDKLIYICISIEKFYYIHSLIVSEEWVVGQNTVKKIREELLLSKAELARKAGVSPLTIDRIERGKNCRMETKRKIILALGYKLSDKDKLFFNDIKL
jgi:DNA-binding XRE family transcriptional regulator